MDASEAPNQQTIVNGQIYLQKRCPMLLGISIGNSYYCKQSIERLFNMAESNSDKVLVFIPHEIHKHTFKAIGYNNPDSRVRDKWKTLKNKCKAAMQKISGSDVKFSYVKWMEEVESCPVYLKALQYIENIYERNEEFRCEIRETTKEVLIKMKASHVKQKHTELQIGLIQDIDIEEGAKFLLKELAFFSAIPKIYRNFEEFVFVYYRTWPDFFEKYFNGYYDGVVKPSLGFVVFE